MNASEIFHLRADQVEMKILEAERVRDLDPERYEKLRCEARNELNFALEEFITSK